MKKRILVTLLAMVMVFSMAFSMTGCGSDAEATWADKYVALLDSGEARDYEGYGELQGELAAIAEEIGATYVYVLTPAGEAFAILTYADGTYAAIAQPQRFVRLGFPLESITERQKLNALTQAFITFLE
jgi:hypothetical protein